VKHNWYAIDFGQTLGAYTALANMQTTYGGDTSNIRARNFNSGSFEVLVDEEQSKDSEIKHTTEDVGWLVIAD